VAITNPAFQTELAISTHVAVSELGPNVTSTHSMVSDIHRDMVKRQETSGDKNASVSVRTLVIIVNDYSQWPRLK